MGAAFAWVAKLFDFFASLFPRLLVIQWSHGGVKYRHGKTRVRLLPGLHVYWPIVTTVETCAVVRQVVNMTAQLLQTADGRAVVVGCIVEYEVEDVLVFLSECEEPVAAIASVAMSAVRDVVVEVDSNDCEPDEMDHALKCAATERLRPYGVRVLSARLSDFAAVRPIHLTGVEWGAK